MGAWHPVRLSPPQQITRKQPCELHPLCLSSDVKVQLIVLAPGESRLQPQPEQRRKNLKSQQSLEKQACQT